MAAVLLVMEMKVSDITTAFLRDHFVKCEDNASNNQIIDMALAGAIQYIKSTCYLTAEELDLYDDMPLAVCALVAEMYDLRQVTVSGNVSLNPTTANILGRYDKNLI